MDHPKHMYSSLTRTRRRLAVLASYAGYVVLMLVWYAAAARHSLALYVLVALLALVMLSGFVVLLTSWVWHAANEPDASLDERQQRIRDRAYLQSYRGLAGLLALVAVYAGIAWDTGWWLPQTENQVQAVVWAVLLITMTLPAAVVAWTEPDLPYEL